MTFKPNTMHVGELGGAVGWGTALKAGRSRSRFPMPLTEVNTWNILWGRGWG